MKNICLTILSLLLFQFTSNAQIVLTQTNTDTIYAGAIYCADDDGVTAGYTHYRAFDLDSLGFTQFNVTDIDFGVSRVAWAPVDFEVKLSVYGATLFPSFGLTELASEQVPLFDTDSKTLMSVPISANVDVATHPLLVIGISVPNEAESGGYTECVLGGNLGGQTKPYYYFSRSCDFHIDPITPISNGAQLVIKVTGNDPLNINEILSKDHIYIYPNPTDGIVNLDISNAVKLENIELYDSIGKQLAEFNNTSTIDISKFKNGVYTLRIQTNEGTISKNIIRN